MQSANVTNGLQLAARYPLAQSLYLVLGHKMD
jgi:hypothetical protein